MLSKHNFSFTFNGLLLFDISKCNTHEGNNNNNNTLNSKNTKYEISTLKSYEYITLSAPSNESEYNLTTDVTCL